MLTTGTFVHNGKVYNHYLVRNGQIIYLNDQDMKDLINEMDKDGYLDGYVDRLSDTMCSQCDPRDWICDSCESISQSDIADWVKNNVSNMAIDIVSQYNLPETLEDPITDTLLQYFKDNTCFLRDYLK